MTSIKDFTKRVFTTSKIMTAVAVVLIGVGVIMGTIFVAGWASKQQKEADLAQRANQSGQSSTSNNSASSDNSTSPSTIASTTYTAAQVAPHSSINDCWMIIGKEVYDLTSFMDQHPGGAQAMLKYCGKDGTRGFATMDRGRGQTHSASASQLKEDYKIGTLAN